MSHADPNVPADATADAQQAQPGQPVQQVQKVLPVQKMLPVQNVQTGQKMQRAQPVQQVHPAQQALHETIDGNPALGDTPPRLARGEGAGVHYRFPDRPPTAAPPPLCCDPARRARPPWALGGGARRALAALGEAAAPTEPLGFAPGPHAIAFVEGYRPYLPPPLGSLLPVGLLGLEWLPVLVGPTRGRLSRLPVEARRAFLARIERRAPAAARDAVHALLGLVKCAIYDHPAVHAALGYAPQPFIDRKVRERRERFGAPEPW